MDPLHLLRGPVMAQQKVGRRPIGRRLHARRGVDARPLLHDEWLGLFRGGICRRPRGCGVCLLAHRRHLRPRLHLYHGCVRGDLAGVALSDGVDGYGALEV